MTDLGHKAAMLRFAEWWMRLALHDRMIGYIFDSLEPENLNRAARATLIVRLVSAWHFGHTY